MRYLAVLTSVLVPTAFALGASAQAGEEGTASGPNAPEAVSEPAPEEPALKLEVDDAGVGVTPSPSRTPDGYTLEEMQRRVRNMKIGVGISGLSVFVGGVLMAFTFRHGVLPDDPDAYTARDDRIGIAAATLATGGVVSLVTTGILLGARKRKLRELESMRPL